MEIACARETPLSSETATQELCIALVVFADYIRENPVLYCGDDKSDGEAFSSFGRRIEHLGNIATGSTVNLGDNAGYDLRFARSRNSRSGGVCVSRSIAHSAALTRFFKNTRGALSETVILGCNVYTCT